MEAEPPGIPVRPELVEGPLWFDKLTTNGLSVRPADSSIMLRRLRRSIPFRLLRFVVVVSTRPVRDWIGRRFLFRITVRTIREMSDDDATHMAAGVAYYAFFSLFPLILGLIAVMSLFMDPHDIQAQLTDFSADYLPASDQLIDANIEAVLRVRGALGLFAAAGLLWSGSAIFGAVSRAVNRAWDVHVDRPFFVSKPRQLGMALSVGLLFLGSLSIVTLLRATSRIADLEMPGLGGLIGQALPSALPWVLQAVSVVMTVSMFLMMYKFMPNTKTYWRYVWPGAVIAGVLFELSKNIFVIYLGRFASFENVYGTLTPVVVLLLWTYLSSLILIFGAELSSEYGRLRSGVARGVLIQSKRRPTRRRGG